MNEILPTKGFTAEPMLLKHHTCNGTIEMIEISKQPLRD